MDFRTASAAAIAIAALCACAPQPVTLTQAMDSCDRGAQFAEVEGGGTVVRVLGVRDTRSGEHEGFIVSMNERRIKVETNVTITGPVPLHRGDRVRLKGQYECDDGVIHWTHHDPRGRHAAGYIEVHGTTYR